ncbi:alpha,alpha-phosphotrehalase [Corynebacterium nasicanis]|uniref:Alpha,alpha-phosphotrehalase n=1 Tax=Corynebacterium nasicanis TaxID=1448267 RepID=A0ABW1QEU9_9CORY
MDGRTVIYQIYPKSFQDSTGDGIGDIRGIIDRIPYLAELGPDMVWFSPFFVSPQRDNGYDVADYRAIDPVMGTMVDVEELIAGLAAHGIGVMFDMVFNHTSTAHEWFQRALDGDPIYRDYYIIRPSAPDGGPPTNWESKFGGSAWAPFGDTGEWYLHLFDITQADLDWRNPRVRQEMADIVNFWLDKGVRGFRFDVINLIGKKEELLSSAPGVDPRVMYTDGEDVHPYLQELRRASFGRVPGTVTVGEMSSTSIERCVAYSNPANGELDMVFNFHHLKVDYPGGEKWALKPYDSADLKRVLNEWAEGMQVGGGWNALFLNNHDQPRAVGRFGDAGELRVEAATMLATLTHTQRGTPFIYQGEEIGMTDPEYTSLADYIDVEAHNAYHSLLDAGLAPADAFTVVLARARDNGRTPVQWDDSPTAGFTTGVPWLRPTNQERINVASELADGRIFRHYQHLIALRRAHPAIAAGSYEAWDREHPAVYAFLRTHPEERVLVVCNLTFNPQRLTLPPEFVDGTVLSDNHPGTKLTPTLPLQPYQALVIAEGAHQS